MEKTAYAGKGKAAVGSKDVVKR